VIERHTAHWKDENQSFCLDNEEDPGDFRCGFIKLVATPVKGGLFEIQHAAPTYGDDPLTKPALVVTGNVLNLH
jgi:hypothetical protein